jgi:superfamily II DNA/RNA helicase
MNEKNKVEILTDDLSLPGIKNYYFKVDKQDEKLEIFCDLIENAIFNLGIVFCNTKETVE